MTGVEIIGLGHYAPEKIVANAEIEGRLGLEPGWIKRRTGIEARRYAADSEALSDTAIKAGEMALEGAGIDRREIGLLLLATSTPDHLLPPTAPLVAYRLGLANARRYRHGRRLRRFHLRADARRQFRAQPSDAGTRHRR